MEALGPDKPSILGLKEGATQMSAWIKAVDTEIETSLPNK
jgi:hypothetical protein